MHNSLTNLQEIKEEIYLKSNDKNKLINLIAVSKNFQMDKIEPLIKSGHTHFGENKIQEAIKKWEILKKKNKNLKLHMLGKLQTNKVKYAIPLFDYIHSLDNIRLAEKIFLEQKKLNKFLKIFIQVNIGNEEQKSGVKINEVKEFYDICTLKLNLKIIGLMCIPPISGKADKFFNTMKDLNDSLDLKELSMGMSSDYKLAISCGSTFIRVGSKIFGPRH